VRRSPSSHIYCTISFIELSSPYENHILYPFEFIFTGNFNFHVELNTARRVSSFSGRGGQLMASTLKGMARPLWAPRRYRAGWPLSGSPASTVSVSSSRMTFLNIQCSDVPTPIIHGLNVDSSILMVVPKYDFLVLLVHRTYFWLPRHTFFKKNFFLYHNLHLADTLQTTSVMIYIASVHRKHFVYIISLNQPKYTVDNQGLARPWPPGWG